ncbi:hypothetical protein EVA_03722, partial [gut metagenome]
LQYIHKDPNDKTATVGLFYLYMKPLVCPELLKG